MPFPVNANDTSWEALLARLPISGHLSIDGEAALLTVD